MLSTRLQSSNHQAYPTIFALPDSGCCCKQTTKELIVYSSSTGALFYNSNGSAAELGTGGQFAALDNLPTLSASDFTIRA